MRLNEIVYTDATPIDGYGPGFFRVGGEVFQGGILTGPKGTNIWKGYTETAALLALVGQIDVLFVGTGSEIAHIPTDFRTTLEEAGLRIDVMNSATACRTYNVLLSEGRRVALALLPV